MNRNGPQDDPQRAHERARHLYQRHITSDVLILVPPAQPRLQSQQKPKQIATNKLNQQTIILIVNLYIDLTHLKILFF